MKRTNSVVKPQQRWLAARYASNARFVSNMANPLLDLLAAKKGEMILDLGCGDGVLTKLICDTGATAIGVDSSIDQIIATRKLGIQVVAMDGHNLAFKPIFDAILTNAALHWMTSPKEVISGMWRSLKPGGRLVGEMGGAGNIKAITQAIYDVLGRRELENKASFPWYFPDLKEYKEQLETQGFDVKYIEQFSRPTPLPGKLENWIDTFGEHFLFILSEDDRIKFKEEVTEVLRPELYNPYNRWVADYVRLRFSATRPV